MQQPSIPVSLVTPPVAQAVPEAPATVPVTIAPQSIVAPNVTRPRDSVYRSSLVAFFRARNGFGHVVPNLSSTSLRDVLCGARLCYAACSLLCVLIFVVFVVIHSFRVFDMAACPSCIPTFHIVGVYNGATGGAGVWVEFCVFLVKRARAVN